MPKRTKKQKLASQTRQHKADSSALESSKLITQDTAVVAFKKDFRKSMIIVALITALEIITYFGTMYYHSR